MDTNALNRKLKFSRPAVKPLLGQVAYPVINTDDVQLICESEQTPVCTFYSIDWELHWMLSLKNEVWCLWWLSLPERGVRSRFQQMVWCCSSQDETQLRMFTTQAQACCLVSAVIQQKHQQQHAPSGSPLLSVHSRNRHVILSSLLAQVVSSRLQSAVWYVTADEPLRTWSYQSEEEEEEVGVMWISLWALSSFAHCPRFLSPSPLSCSGHCVEATQAEVDLSVLSVDRESGVLGGCLPHRALALPHGPTALPAVLKETQQRHCAALSSALYSGDRQGKAWCGGNIIPGGQFMWRCFALLLLFVVKTCLQSSFCIK